MAEQSRDVQEQQLASLRRALVSANNTLELVHGLCHAPGHEQSGADRLDVAQTAVVTLEERIALLENHLSEAHATSDRSYVEPARGAGLRTTDH
jgi:hypothetical protein